MENCIFAHYVKTAQTMKRLFFLHTAIFLILLQSCQTVNQLPIDYLVPADISFPAQIKKVAIINNVSESPGRIKEDSALDSILLIQTKGYLERYTLNGDPQIAIESLAESVASENYFNEVVICDSALHVSGAPKSEPHLNKSVINNLTSQLDVDMLIVLEQLQIKVQRQVFPMGEMGFLGNIDAKVYPRVSLYIPNRNTPLVLINGNDSIFWEEWGSTLLNARTKIAPDEQLITEASDFAGTIPIKYITPHWKTANRYIFINGSPEMRDAAFLLQNEDWEKALPIWEKAYHKYKGKKKARAASNISFYYEIKDDLDKAEEWGKKALDLMKVVDKIEGDVDSSKILSMDHAYIYHNQLDLAERRTKFSALKMQMDRFNDDF